MYAATSMEKLVTVDDFEHGCETQSTCTFCESIDVTADTLKGLVDQLGQRYGLKMDDVWTPDDGPGVQRIGFNRLETAEGDEPTERQRELWKAGQYKLWLADYSFSVERRAISYPTIADFRAEGIKTHE